MLYNQDTVFNLSLSDGTCTKEKCVATCEEGWEKHGDHCYHCGSPRRWTGPMPRNFVKRRLATWRLSPQMKQWASFSWARTVGTWNISGLEATTSNRKVFGSGRTAYRGISNSGEQQVSLTMQGGEHCLTIWDRGTVWNDWTCSRETEFLCSRKICPTNSNSTEGISYFWYWLKHLHRICFYGFNLFSKQLKLTPYWSGPSPYLEFCSCF